MEPVDRRIEIRSAVLFFTTIACIMISSTYDVFGHTWDEPEQIAAGLVLLDTGRYPYDPQHPPLARVAMAAGPYLAGARSFGNPPDQSQKEGTDVLYGSGRYDEFLKLAREGMLPFFVLLVLSTWFWAHRLFGEVGAALAAYFVCFNPVILAHAGIAELDLPLTACTLLAMFLLHRWFEEPSIRRAAACGAASGLASGTKFTAPPFLALAAASWAVAAYLQKAAVSRAGDRVPNPESPKVELRARDLLLHAGVATGVAFVFLLLCYGFNFRLVPIPEWGISLPAGIERLKAGFDELRAHNNRGHIAYFLGEVRTTGWWTYYAVVLAVKTPLPLLISFLFGALWLIRASVVKRDWLRAAPVLAALSIFFFCSTLMRVNIGVRHVLILYPLMAMVAAAWLAGMWKRFPMKAARAAILAVVLWQGAIANDASPDFLAYFNVLAGEHPEYIVNDSDLDWGQDLRRLEKELRARGITQINLVYRGSADLGREALPPYRILQPAERVTGWVAANLLAKATLVENGGFKWLDAYTPVMRIGKSIDLYYIPPEASSDAHG